MIWNHLKEAYENNDFYKNMLNNMPDDDPFEPIPLENWEVLK